MAIYLLAHVIGDFYLQTPTMAKDKKTSLPRLITHCLIYCIPFALMYIFDISSTKFRTSIIMLITLVLVHALIDIAKYYLEKTDLLKGIKRKNEYFYNLWLFQIDQVLHILLIVLIISFFDHNLVYRYDKMVVLLVLYIAIIMKPANLYLLLLTNKYIPKQSSLGIEGAGKFIGTLERLLYIVSILTSHYEGIALVISVKAFARYKKIADEPEFAEYFTIGTLTSLLISILLYFVVFNLKSSVHF